jgi:hypothetical protein
MALIQRAGSQGWPLGTSASGAGKQTTGCVRVSRSRPAFNMPFPKVKAWVKY